MTPMAIGRTINASDIDTATAREMAEVGIVPSWEGPDKEPVGYKFNLAGQMFVVTAYVTKDEFLEAVERSNISNKWVFKGVPTPYFQRISTD